MFEVCGTMEKKKEALEARRDYLRRSPMNKIVKLVLAGLMAAAFSLFLVPVSAQAAGNTGGINMYRLYNGNSGEHFYTANPGELDSLIRIGWTYEGIGWVAPEGGDPVYRLYNPNAGDHHYTVNVHEKDALVRLGWNYEGIGWHSGGSVPLFRQYNPNAKTGTHNYTTNEQENNYLVRIGWNAEGIGWYALAAGSSKNTADEQTSIRLAGTKTAQKTNQIILVNNHQLTFWEKNSDGTWRKELASYCGYGRNGLSYNRRAGDMTTPIGSFPILMAFGKGNNPGTAMTYKKIGPNSYWSDDTNYWTESPVRIGGEHLTDYYQYKYAMGIGFNYNPYVKGRGSCIFLHCKSYDHWPTAGCVSVPENIMLDLLKKSRNGTYIIIVPREQEIVNY